MRRPVITLCSFLLPLVSVDPTPAQSTLRVHSHESRWREGPLDSSKVDWTLFPRAYGVLGSERLMYPVDVGNWPVKIDLRRQLFVDNHLIAHADNVRRTVHHAEKYGGNPILTGIEPWEADKRLILIDVLHDVEADLFRMWYTTSRQFTLPGTNHDATFPTLYAESPDGINWNRPRLGLLEYDGTKDNNWVLYSRMYGAFLNPDRGDPAKRILATVLHRPPVGEEGLYLYASPDGIRWELVREEPIVAHQHKATKFPFAGFDDTTIVRWDPSLNLFVCDAEIRLSGAPFRGRCLCTSDDLVHWSQPRMTLFQDALDNDDAQVYGHVSFVYESMWLGMPRLIRWARTGWKQVEVELSASRDGLNWTRVGDLGSELRRQTWSGQGTRPLLLQQGDDNEWDRDFSDPAHSGPILVGDELWFYYRGSFNLASRGIDGWEFALGLAKLRRDGFASIDAGDTPGTVTTRPLTFAGRTLHVNACVEGGGDLRVTLLTPDGSLLDGYDLQNCVAFHGDSTDEVISWEHGRDLVLVQETREHVRLRFHMRDAKLYAFWFED